jgi:hypothetical protein
MNLLRGARAGSVLVGASAVLAGAWLMGGIAFDRAEPDLGKVVVVSPSPTPMSTGNDASPRAKASPQRRAGHGDDRTPRRTVRTPAEPPKRHTQPPRPAPRRAPGSAATRADPPPAREAGPDDIERGNDVDERPDQFEDRRDERSDLDERDEGADADDEAD